MRRALRISLTVYAALLVAPIGAFAPAPTWPSVVVGAVLGAVVGLGVTTGLDGPGRLLAVPRALVGLALPLGWLWPVVDGQVGFPAAAFTPWAVGSLAVLPWLIAVTVAAEWRRRDRVDALTEHVRFEARNPPGTRRQIRIAVGVLLVLSGGTVALVAVLGVGDTSGSLVWMLPAMFSGWLPLFADSDGKEVAVTDGGLRVERQVHDWETIERYELTDDALTLHRPAWYRADLSFDRSDIDDIDAVTGALDRYVGRY